MAVLKANPDADIPGRELFELALTDDRQKVRLSALALAATNLLVSPGKVLNLR